MTNLIPRVIDHLQAEDGFVIGRVALVVLILAIIIVAAVVALLVPN